jgi:hypothetical protein
MVVTGSVLVPCLYIVFVLEPYAVKIYPDRFVLRCILSSRIYRFVDVSNVSLDIVSQTKGGFLKTVRVDFHSGKTLQLAFPNVRQRLYDDLNSSWRVAA